MGFLGASAAVSDYDVRWKGPAHALEDVRVQLLSSSPMSLSDRSRHLLARDRAEAFSVFQMVTQNLAEVLRIVRGTVQVDNIISVWQNTTF
mmetsp:Transcript_40171/g.106302  ORF Transcript_40171/g.106302 Transcript_40171/m.106302 type:complete len:91 (+) Transcript_40171:1796-2068(+)